MWSQLPPEWNPGNFATDWLHEWQKKVPWARGLIQNLSKPVLRFYTTTRKQWTLSERQGSCHGRAAMNMYCFGTIWFTSLFCIPRSSSGHRPFAVVLPNSKTMWRPDRLSAKSDRPSHYQQMNMLWKNSHISPYTAFQRWQFRQKGQPVHLSQYNVIHNGDMEKSCIICTFQYQGQGKPTLDQGISLWSPKG